MTTCPNCKYHHVDELAQVGVCRRYPPQAQQLGANWNASFPPVNKNWTCGEFAAAGAIFANGDLVFDGVAPPPKPMWTPVSVDAGASKPEPQEAYDIPDHIRKLAKELADRGDEPDDWLDYVGAALEIWAKIKPVDNAKPPIDAA